MHISIYSLAVRPTDTDNASGLSALSYTSMIKWITNTNIIHSSAFMHRLSPPHPQAKCTQSMIMNSFFFIKKKILNFFIFIFWNLVYYTFCTLPNTKSNHLPWSEPINQKQKPNLKKIILFYFENNFIWSIR